jgi:hypothetical protein
MLTPDQTRLLHYLDKIPGAVYALIGVALGGWITWYSQHRHWVLDNKKQEYRELIDGLFRATEEIVKARPNVSSGWNEGVINAAWSGTRLLQNRIFVARTILGSGVREDWQKIVNVAQWEPGEPEIDIGGKQYSYTPGAISLLRNALEQKLLAIVQRDLRL